MQFACLTGVAPGLDLPAQCAAIGEAGCAGVETLILPTTNLERWQAALKSAAANANVQPVAVIVGGLALFTEDQAAYVCEAMQAIQALGAATLITPEYQSQNPLPLFPPYPAPTREEQDRVDQALDEISTAATRLNATVLMEPITQFESRFWRDVPTVRGLCERLKNPWMKAVLDFHNMNITEADINQSIRETEPHIGHVHLADNNRRLPGHGHINFAEGLGALRDVNYAGWFSFECAVSQDDFAAELQKSMRWLEKVAQTSRVS